MTSGTTAPAAPHPPTWRVGLLGGSFDPVHNGHLQTARTALERCHLQRVVWMPGATPPHKRGRQLADAEHRLAMLRLALAPEPRFELSRLEIDRGGVSYTIDTLTTLRSVHPDWDLWLILGMDSLRDLPTWYRATEVVDLCTVVTVARPGVAAPEDLPGLTPAQQARLRCHHLTERVLDLSSTEIRTRIAQRRSIRYLVPDAVATYIQAHQLYTHTAAPHSPTPESRHDTA